MLIEMSLGQNRRAVLHIGVEKTGSSTLQYFLASNRSKLQQNGFMYPKFCGEFCHKKLAVHAENDERIDDLRAEEGLSSAEDVKRFRLNLKAEATTELAGSQFETAIFSSEHCSSRVIEHSEIVRLKEFMLSLFDECKIVVYLRRQDRLQVSHYSTHLKGGGAGYDVLRPVGRVPVFLDYEKLLDAWAGVFGRENVMPRIYSRSELSRGSVVDDFVDLLGLGNGYTQVEDVNESLLPVAQEVLRQLNQEFPRNNSQLMHPTRRNIYELLVRHFTGQGRLPARAEAMSLCDQYTASNASVLKQWFPERKQLFDSDFSIYPEKPVSVRLTFADVAEISKVLWNQRSCRQSLISTQALLIRIALGNLIRRACA